MTAILGSWATTDIVRVLWEANGAHEYDDGSASTRTMSSTALWKVVGEQDNGKVKYHLDELSPHSLRLTEVGYRLSGAGKQIARTVVAVS